MNKATSRSRKVKEMQAEYDFASMKGGVRGKYTQSYRTGHTVKIHQDDGTTLVQHFNLEEGAVVIEPDLREYFPDAEAVNTALRCLVPLMPKKRKSKAKA